MNINYINNTINFEDYVTNLSAQFTKHGEYYYYNGTFNTNDVIKIFDSIRIPDNLESVAANEKIKIVIDIEALQIKNFSPDYTLEDPWKGIEPTKNIRSAYDINVDDSKLIIKYENETEEDIDVPNNFLENTKEILPGDSFTEIIQINNKNKKNASFYIKTDANENDKETIKLLSQIDLIIRSGDEIIYKGKFYNEEKVLLAKLNKGEGKKLQFEVSIPIELSSEYSNIVPKLSITFSAKYDNEKMPLNPKTGDNIKISLLIFLFSSMSLVIIIVLSSRERKNKNI